MKYHLMHLQENIEESECYFVKGPEDDREGRYFFKTVKPVQGLASY